MLNDKTELAMTWRESNSFCQYCYYNIEKKQNIYRIKEQTAFQMDMFLFIHLFTITAQAQQMQPCSALVIEVIPFM